MNQIQSANVVSRAVVRPTRRAGVRSAYWLCFAYVISIALAELLATYIDPMYGVLVHIMVLGVVLYQLAVVSHGSRAHLLLVLLLPSVVRLLSLSLPFFSFDPSLWYVVITVPLLAGALAALRALGYSLRTAGFTLGLRGLPLQIIVIGFGIFLGMAQFAVLPAVANLFSQNVIAGSLVLVISTGVVEALIFRGILQQATEKPLGKIGAMLFASLVFTALHIGWNSPVNLLLVFGASIIWGGAFMSTRSIVGIALAQGLANVMLFIFLPLV